MDKLKPFKCPTPDMEPIAEAAALMKDLNDTPELRSRAADLQIKVYCIGILLYTYVQVERRFGNKDTLEVATARYQEARDVYVFFSERCVEVFKDRTGFVRPEYFSIAIETIDVSETKGIIQAYAVHQMIQSDLRKLTPETALIDKIKLVCEFANSNDFLLGCKIALHGIEQLNLSIHLYEKILFKTLASEGSRHAGSCYFQFLHAINYVLQFVYVWDKTLRNNLLEAFDYFLKKKGDPNEKKLLEAKTKVAKYAKSTAWDLILAKQTSEISEKICVACGKIRLKD